MIKLGGIELALGLQQIFTSRFDVRGETTPTGAHRDDGKEEVKVSMYKENITTKHFLHHIQGKLPALGLVPIRPGTNDCKWGCIDIDEYNFDHKKIIQDIKKLKLPLVVFRSKSGGAHIFLFASEWIPARMMRTKLKMISKALGYQGSEIFPKQDEVEEYGSFLNIPYLDGENTVRYAHDEEGDAVEIYDLGFVYRKMIQSEEQISNLKVSVEKQKQIKKEEAFPDGPPCLNTLAKQGFTTGSRNEALYNIGVYAKKAFSEGEWQRKVAEYNTKYFDPPLGYTEEQATIKSVEKKDFKYKCKQQPIEAVCQASMCQFCKHGVGGNKYQLPEITNLIKICTDPVSYLVTVEGRQVKLTAEQWLKPAMFADAVYNQINKVIPRMPKREEWLSLVVAPLSEEGAIQEVKGIESFTPSYRLQRYLIDFITEFDTGKHIDDIGQGVCYTKKDKDGEAIETVIRAEDFLDYITRNGWRFSHAETSSLFVQLKPLFKKETRRMVRGRNINVIITKPIEKVEYKTSEVDYDNSPF